MAPPTEIRLTPSSASPPTVGASGSDEDAHGHVDRGEELAQLGRVDHSRREENVGAGLLVGLEAGNRVGQVLAPVEVVLGAGRQDEVHRPLVCGLGRSTDALRRVAKLVDRVVAVAGEVLDRPAGEPLLRWRR